MFITFIFKSSIESLNVTFEKTITLHKISEDQDWNKTTNELIRDYIPLVILIAMVIIGIALIIIK
jgi:hypothetical protein